MSWKWKIVVKDRRRSVRMMQFQLMGCADGRKRRRVRSASYDYATKDRMMDDGEKKKECKSLCEGI